MKCHPSFFPLMTILSFDKIYPSMDDFVGGKFHPCIKSFYSWIELSFCYMFSWKLERNYDTQSRDSKEWDLKRYLLFFKISKFTPYSVFRKVAWLLIKEFLGNTAPTQIRNQLFLIFPCFFYCPKLDVIFFSS